MVDLPTIAIRLADEGVPVRAIARGLNVSSTELFEQFALARCEGRLIAVPRADWSPSTSRRNRAPEFKRKGERETMLSSIMRVFSVTTCQSRLVLALIQRPELSREQLYDEDITVSTVKVQICRIRRRFKKFDLEIETSWGCGWRMPAPHRDRALELVLAALEK